MIIDAKVVMKTKRKRPPRAPSMGPTGAMVLHTPYSKVLNTELRVETI